MTKSVSLQSGIAQVERERIKALLAQSVVGSSVSSQASGEHKSHSDEEILDKIHGTDDNQLKSSRTKTTDDSAQSSQETLKVSNSDVRDSCEQLNSKETVQAKSDKTARPQSLPLSSWDDVAADKNLTVMEERGIASGSSSPNIMEEISGTMSKIEQLNKSGDNVNVCRKKASHGEWYGNVADEPPSVQRTISRDLDHLSSSQESIEA